MMSLKENNKGETNVGGTDLQGIRRCTELVTELEDTTMAQPKVGGEN